MGLRCDSCNKFAAYDTETEPEISSEEVSDDGVVTCEARIVNTCADCGQEMTEANFSFEIDSPDALTAHLGKIKNRDKHELSVEIEGSRSDRTQTKDRHGNPIKRSRYMRRYYGVDITATISCSCGQTFEVTSSDEIQASGMEDCR